MSGALLRFRSGARVAYAAFLQGLERTRGSVIRKEFKDILQAGNIDEIRASLDDVHDALMDLDIFDIVDMSIEPSKRVGGDCFALHRICCARLFCELRLRIKSRCALSSHAEPHKLDYFAGAARQVRCDRALQREAPLPRQGRHVHTGERRCGLCSGGKA